MAQIRHHQGMGLKILMEISQINEECRLIVLQHHERYNGTGYPRKLHGDHLHIYGRICSAVNAYDALISKRPYKLSLQPFDEFKIIRDEMLGYFQRDIFEKFILLFK
jgi:HD-GYP domain-containing protein (c-di-GMP phosphodiesterase class II)